MKKTTLNVLRKVILSACVFSNFLIVDQILASEILKNKYQVVTLVDKINQKNLTDSLKEFVSISRPGRVPGASGHKKAQDYIRSRLGEFSGDQIEIAENKFLIDAKKKINGINFIWEKKSLTTNAETIILSAFYDSKFLGADKNATGVIGLLEFVKQIYKLHMPYHLKIIFLDSSGSASFVESLALKTNDKVSFLHLHLTMLGHDSKAFDTEKKFNNYKIYSTSTHLNIAHKLAALGDKMYSTFQFKTGLLSEDHSLFLPLASFSSAGITTLIFTHNLEADPNNRVDTINDFPETLNFQSYTKALRNILSAVLAYQYGIVKE